MSSAKHQRNVRVSATKKNKILNTVSSISSSSPPSPSPSSSSSSSSSSPLHSQDSQEAQKSSLITNMEEVWEDINLASIHHLNRHSQHPQHNHEPRFRSHNHHQDQNPNSIFQDFLNRPLNHESNIPTSLNRDTTTVTALFSSSPLPPPETVLSLNSGAGFEFLDNQDPLVTPNSTLPHLTNVPSFNTSLEDLTSFERNNVGFAIEMLLFLKRVSGFYSLFQAYTNELELEVAHLQAENARLRRQQEQLRMAAANQQPKKNTLQRSSTAPF
ncbi:unnamed protein product [Eruca vesicaria subsp. sativa]|uniref:Uncharacterized protein n=1 Tax=Eruca vesicaria subsp. sativa TaxID=29727 RepID=A0ABC8K501_ERUVS|nr:unnamed protein product [Eruca vesicaria subsp. sativa]